MRIEENIAINLAKYFEGKMDWRLKVFNYRN